MFDQLLLAIDSSPAGAVATDFAGGLARRCSASVHVVCVNPLLRGRRGLTLLVGDEAVRVIDDAVSRLRQAGVYADGSVQVAPPRAVPERIVATAVEEGADAIVLGSRRWRSVPDRLFACRVRDRVLRRTSLPVIVAPTPLDLEDRADVDLDALLGTAVGGR